MSNREPLYDRFPCLYLADKLGFIICSNLLFLTIKLGKYTLRSRNLGQG